MGEYEEEELGNVDMSDSINTMEAHRLTASTLESLQMNHRPRLRRLRGVRTGGRRAQDGQGHEGLEVTLAQMEKALGLGNRRGNGQEEKRLVAQVNAVAVLDMIKDLQDEIKD